MGLVQPLASTTTPTVGFVAIGRPTFDVASAAAPVARALDDLRSVAPHVVGDGVVRLAADEVRAAVDDWPASVETVVVVFATFTDSTLPAAVCRPVDRDGQRVRRPRLVLWSLPEPRVERRLVWNSLCGSILAMYRLRNASIDATSIHGLPGVSGTVERLVDALGDHVADGDLPGASLVPQPRLDLGPDVETEVERVAAVMATARVGVVGRPPTGFEPCELTVEPSPIGARFEQIELGELFARAEQFPSSVEVGLPASRRPEVQGLLGVGEREPVALTRSLRLHDALRSLATDHRWDAVAVRCWPECFTVWGGAACAPLSFLTDEGLPAACEADGYGALSSLLLETVSGRAAFLADLVDVDTEANTAAFWHCGVAPRSMADPTRPVAAIDHPNRGVPLALHFGLAPGPVTMCRISQSGGRLRLAVGFGEAIGGPPPFTGTSGTVRFLAPVEGMLRRIAEVGLEHHVVLVPGDHRAVLAALADHWGLPLLVITPSGTRSGGVVAVKSECTYN